MTRKVLKSFATGLEAREILYAAGDMVQNVFYLDRTIRKASGLGTPTKYGGRMEETYYQNKLKSAILYIF